MLKDPRSNKKYVVKVIKSIIVVIKGPVTTAGSNFTLEIKNGKDAPIIFDNNIVTKIEIVTVPDNVIQTKYSGSPPAIGLKSIGILIIFTPNINIQKPKVNTEVIVETIKATLNSFQSTLK